MPALQKPFLLFFDYGFRCWARAGQAAWTPSPRSRTPPSCAAPDTVDATEVAPEVLDYLVALVVRRTRELPSVELGPARGGGPPARRREGVGPAGRPRLRHARRVGRMALPVLRHRLVLTPEAELERYTPESAVRGALDAVPVPR